MMGNVIDLHRRQPTARERAVTFVQFVGSLPLDGWTYPENATETLQGLIRQAREIAGATS